MVDALATLQAALLLPENASRARDHAPCEHSPTLSPTCEATPPQRPYHGPTFGVSADTFDATYRRLAAAVPPSQRLPAGAPDASRAPDCVGDKEVEEYDPTKPYYDS